MRTAMKWSYGVITVQARRDTLLPRTLESLYGAGFDKPHLFVDGDPSGYEQFGLSITSHNPALDVVGNWITALWELFIRSPAADRYAIFEDDLLICRNVREYLVKSPYPGRGYLNLFTVPKNMSLSLGNPGWFLSNQFGRGALALVFNNEAATTLLIQPYLIQRAKAAHNTIKRWTTIDGAVVTALKQANHKEFTHNPSLVYHTGNTSSIGHSELPNAPSFPGETFNALELL